MGCGLCMGKGSSIMAELLSYLLFTDIQQSPTGPCPSPWSDNQQEEAWEVTAILLFHSHGLLFETAAANCFSSWTGKVVPAADPVKPCMLPFTPAQYLVLLQTEEPDWDHNLLFLFPISDLPPRSFTLSPVTSYVAIICSHALREGHRHGGPR